MLGNWIVQNAPTLYTSLVQDGHSRHDDDNLYHHYQRRRLNEIYKNEIKNGDDDNPFFTVPAARVFGPTSFPRPTDISADLLVPYLEPIQGQHRSDQDAVLLFASEYTLNTYVLFIESLRATGFAGDICLVVHPSDWDKPAIREYLQSYQGDDGEEPRVIVYAPTPHCYNMERHVVDSSKGGSRTCQFHNLYGRPQPDGTLVGVRDPRPDRTVANIRYELYWLMACRYDKHSWLMLVDARDTVFQTNPFASVPRSSLPEDDPAGLLYFFGENRNATRIGLSKQNNKWIRTAYGDAVGDALAGQPTICSGATLGEQVALETYLRAMVAEADETGTVLMGSDQGFHNRLYYSAKLQNAVTIQSITVFDQGTGIVNNMGAMRTKPLKDWGNGRIIRQDGKDYQVLNWDGSLRYVISINPRPVHCTIIGTMTQP